MLPTGKRDNSTALQTILYTVWLVAASIVPVFGITGQLKISVIAASLIFLIGVWIMFYAVKLYKQKTEKAAKSLMLVSIGYITFLQLIYIVDKFLR